MVYIKGESLKPGILSIILQLLVFRVLEIPPFSIPGFRDSGLSIPGFRDSPF